MSLTVKVAELKHEKFADIISQHIEEAAKARGTGISKRPPEYIRKKIKEGNAIIAVDGDNFAGFCYIETWSHGEYVANSGLIVSPDYRNHGLAKKIKQEAFKLSRKNYPQAKIFGITTSLPVMKINSELGYRPVTFSELTDQDEFWNGCQSCPNYDILMRNNRKNCLCTGMLFDPQEQKKQSKNSTSKLKANLKRFEKWLKQKQQAFLNKFSKHKEPQKEEVLVNP